MDLSGSPLHERMIFNVGAQRSGTFWLQRVVTAHSAISAIPSESALFSDGIAPLFERFQQAASNSPQLNALYVERPQLVAATRAFCDAVLADYLEPGARFLAERTPMHVSHGGPDSVEDAAAEWRSCIERDGARSATRTCSTIRSRSWRGSTSGSGCHRVVFITVRSGEVAELTLYVIPA